MSQIIGNPLKSALRKRMKNEILKTITPESRIKQSEIITKKVLESDAFAQAKHVSVYLSTAGEVDTCDLLKELFSLRKIVYVPTYSGPNMEMVRLKDMADYDSLPLTKWHIKQPNVKDQRENAMTNGKGIDLFLMPGVAFTLSGKRLGHGMGYYDKYLSRHKAQYPEKNVTLMALAFNEQIVDENALPTDENDVQLTCVVTPLVE